LPVWQALREELKDKNFEVITVACESKGAPAALPFVQAANQQHPSLLDEHHRMPELYNTKNVPAAFWIDEGGRILRANDPIYAQRRNRETGEVTTNHKYLNALRDWVEKGPRSHYIQDQQGVEARRGVQTWEDVQARAFFRLGLHLHRQGHVQDAIVHFKRAHALRPNDWNYKRQAWNLGNVEKDYGTTLADARKDPASEPFYLPLDLPEPSQA